MPFLGSFQGRLGGGGGGGSLDVWLAAEGFSLVSGTAGSPTSVWERTYTTSGTSNSNYTLSYAPIPAKLQLMIVAGGSGSMGGLGGGGGAGGVLWHPAYTMSTVSNISITVGGGSSGGSNHNTGISNGNNSVFGDITVYGGGRPGQWSTGYGAAGGSGGGCNGHWGGYYGGGGVTQPLNASGGTHYGNRGGNKNETYYYVGGGGGGAGANGGANGGNGVTLLGRTVGGGGGGGTHVGWGYYPTSSGGSGGGGRGTQWYWGRGVSGTDNTGGGGGCGHHSPDYGGGRGGCGIIYVRCRLDGQQI